MKIVIILLTIFIIFGLLMNAALMTIDKIPIIFGDFAGIFCIFILLGKTNISNHTNKFGCLVILFVVAIIQTLHYYFFYSGVYSISNLFISIIVYWFVVILFFIPQINNYIQKIFRI